MTESGSDHTTPNEPTSSLGRRLRARFGLGPPREKRDLHTAIAGDDEAKYRPVDWDLTKRILTRLAPYKWRYVLGISLGVIMVLLEMQSPLFIRAIINTATSDAASGEAAPIRTASASDRFDSPIRVADPIRAATVRERLDGEQRGSVDEPPDAQPSLANKSNASSHTGSEISNLKSPTPNPTHRVFSIILIWSIVVLVAILLQRITILIMASAGERVQFDLRRDLFAHLQRLSMSYYDRTKLGRIISRCTSDLSSLREINVWGIDTVVKNSLMLLVAAVMLLATSPRIFLSVVWLGPVLFICNRIYRHKAAVAYQIMREGFTRVSTNMAENITGVRVVTAFNRQMFNLSVFNRLQDANTVNAIRTCRINGVYQPMLQFIGLTGRIIILLHGGYLVVQGQIAGVGSVVASFLYWDWFMNPILNFGTFYNQLMAAMAGAERVFDLLDTHPDIEDSSHAKLLSRIDGAVRFDNVTFGYKPDRPVLHEVTFEAKPGQMIALVGPTGAGKSSIISLIARFYQPQQGRILVDEHDLRGITGESLHRQMGMVLQSSFLFTGTVAENIRYARPDASDEEVIAAARAIGVDKLILALPHGFQTTVGERGAQLSLGQRQLVCFARAFLADPRIFLLDEATSSIDSATEQMIQESLERLRAGRTTFVVAHRLSTIQRADLILVIDDGRIIERGSHRELLRTPGRYARLHREFIRS